MDESELVSLIAKGEHQGLEFKRELHLETKMDKGEFVKDIIAIANSAPSNRGYLLVGVGDDGSIVGTEELQEETIQEIAHTYIRPAVTLRCSTVSMQAAGLPTVGLIEIEGIERPYSFTRDIARWKQDDVFVRHGSVVKRATPAEIIRMRHESQRRRSSSVLSRILTGLLTVILVSELGSLVTSSLLLAMGLVSNRLPSSTEPTTNTGHLAPYIINLCCVPSIASMFCGTVVAVPLSLLCGMPVAIFGLVISLPTRSRPAQNRLNLVLSLLIGIIGLFLLLVFFSIRVMGG